ncbi:Flavoprotein-like protein YCP4 [Leucoagaricus sp. SymC.cos]|nr:Flavoprotein-like protein YCP4 [Leucoagaricus sp. SymC.cos]
MPGFPRVAIIIYSMYDHIAKLAEAEKKGIERAGGQAEIFRVQETLTDEVLQKMNVPKDRMLKTRGYEVADALTLERYDAYLFGIQTRFGNMPAQWKVFWDHTGKQWARRTLARKFAGVFVSTNGLGGGQEETGYTLMTTLVHHGIVFVPFGYAHAFEDLTNIEEVHGGGSPWGAGVVAGSDGSRNPSQLEITIAEKQGAAFWELVSRVDFTKDEK